MRARKSRNTILTVSRVICNFRPLFILSAVVVIRASHSKRIGAGVYDVVDYQRGSFAPPKLGVLNFDCFFGGIQIAL